MLRCIIALLCVSATTLFAFALKANTQPKIDIVDLGGGNFDITVQRDPGPRWANDGLGDTTDGGAAFVYTEDPNDTQTRRLKRAASGGCLFSLLLAILVGCGLSIRSSNKQAHR